MVFLQEYPEALLRRRDSWDNKRSTWLTKAKREEEMYFHDVEGTGTTFTAAQKEIVEQKSGIPVNINYIHPLLNQKLSILASTKPSFRVVGLDRRGKDYANVLNKAVRSVMYNSEATGEEEETIKSMLISGMGISGIEEQDYYQFGSFNVDFIDIHPSIIILDANAKKRSMKDSKGYFIEKEVESKEAEKRYAGIIAKINELRALEGENPIDITYFENSSKETSARDRGTINEDWEESKVLVTEYYDKVLTKMFFVKDPKGNVKRIFRENLEPDADFIITEAEDFEENFFVRKTLMLGNWKVAEELKPIKEFAIKVKFFEWGGSPYTSYGMAHFIRPMQETLDKAVQLMLMNGILTNNAGYLSPKGGIDIEDKAKWEKQGNTPGAVKEFNPITINGQTFIPQREQIQQLSNFYPTIIQLMVESMRTSTGIHASISGDAKEAGIDVFSSLKQYQDAAMQRVKLAMAHVNLANQHLGNVCLDYLLANIDLDEKYAFFDEGGQLNEVQILKEQLEAFATGRYMVLGVPSEAMPTEKLAMANSLMQVAQTTPDPYERNVYIQRAFELSDMRGYDEMKDEVDTVNRLKQQLSSAEEELKRDKELMKQYENRALNAEYEAKLAKKVSGIESDLEVSAALTEADIKIEKLQKQLKDAQKNASES